MAERLKAPVLKTGMGQPIVGSNPSPSALAVLVTETVSTVVLQFGEVPEWLNGAAC
jgi:hypothetical protein